MLITKSNQSDESVSVLLGVTCNKTVKNLLFLVKTSEFKSGYSPTDNPSFITNLIKAE